jgi:hypothetical protein
MVSFSHFYRDSIRNGVVWFEDFSGAARVSVGMSRIRPELELEEMLEESDRDLYVQKQQKHASRSVVTQSN